MATASPRTIHPRTVYLLPPILDCHGINCTNTSRHQSEFFRNELGEYKPPHTEPLGETTPEIPPSCVPKDDWHSFHFVNCNQFHEIRLSATNRVSNGAWRDG